MGFCDKYAAFNEWNWMTYSTGVSIDINEFIANKNPNTEFYIGSDSQNYSKKGKSYCTFSSCLIAYARKKGGNAILAVEKTEKLDNLRQRLLIETMRSLEIGWYLDTKNINNPISIHLDVNSDLRFKSTKYKDELVGFVTAQGFNCEHKPDSWAASWAADKRC